MNISRMCMDGSTHPEEQLNKSQIYITTAGWKNTFPCEKTLSQGLYEVTHIEKPCELKKRCDDNILSLLTVKAYMPTPCQAA